MATSTAPARQRSARGEGERLRHDLLESAAELMATHGDIENVSLRAVARHAGVSATAVYRHFDDHLDLLRQSVDYCWTNFREVLIEARRSSTNPFEAFRAMGEAYMAFAFAHPGQYRVLFSNKIDVGPTCETASESAFQLLIDNVAEMLARLDDGRDPFFVGVQVHTWIHGIVDLCGNQPDVDWPSPTSLLDGLGLSLGLYERPT